MKKIFLIIVLLVTIVMQTVAQCIYLGINNSWQAMERKYRQAGLYMSMYIEGSSYWKFDNSNNHPTIVISRRGSNIQRITEIYTVYRKIDYIETMSKFKKYLSMIGMRPVVKTIKECYNSTSMIYYYTSNKRGGNYCNVGLDVRPIFDEGLPGYEPCSYSFRRLYFPTN